MHIPKRFVVLWVGATWLLGAVAWGQNTTQATPRASLTASDSLAMRVQRITVASAVFPGAGQIANHQWWKVPVVWGGWGYAAWSVRNNAMEMRGSIDDLVALTDDDPSTVPTLTDAAGNLYDANQLEDRALFYRRNRDLSFLSLLIVHGLQVLDANTGAMLQTLDTGDALSMHLNVIEGAPGVSLILRPGANLGSRPRRLRPDHLGHPYHSQPDQR
ncbi:MAG: DUF5683 domain-containing protein [Bacteroidetes bacterium]|nr:DUF5683 domain-containing protein [Bacteroidota bacterium]MDA0903072.1 DUF5683 domain-containing protein [Bacteroidota bacterium]MDA1241718.1 DUF5683 domain-containing protein [Bacteroidota bacterium]